VLVRPPLVPLQDAVVEGVPRPSVTVTLREGWIEISPLGAADTLLILYPGGLVRPHAYTWLGVALAPSGVRTLIPVFPFDLAVLAPDRAEVLLEAFAGETPRTVLAGHSLGGAMAARFVRRHPGAVDALVLMGAFSAQGDDLSGTLLPTLVLAAEHDGLATLEEVRAGMARLPAGARLEVLEGAVHSFFGRYGPQRGDGIPTVTRGAAEARIVRAVEAFLAREVR